MKTILSSLLFAVLSFGAQAAELPGTAPATADRLAAENARAAAKRDDAASAEQMLATSTRAQPNTSWWHFEMAQRLIQLAYDVPREGRSQIIPTIVSRAIQHLTTAESLTSDPLQRASIKAFAGRIQERYLGDHAAAMASFRAAAALSPEHPQAKAAADRLQRTTEAMAEKARK